MSKSYGEAFYKAQEAIQSKLPLEGNVLISVNDKDKPEAVEAARIFAEDGFRILATGRTYDQIVEAGIKAEKVKKLYEGHPNIKDMIINGEIQLIINSPAGKSSVTDDSYLRKTAIKAKVPYVTTIAAGKACAEGIHYVKSNPETEIKSLQEYHSEIK